MLVTPRCRALSLKAGLHQIMYIKILNAIDYQMVHLEHKQQCVRVLFVRVESIHTCIRWCLGTQIANETFTDPSHACACREQQRQERIAKEGRDRFAAEQKGA